MDQLSLDAAIEALSFVPSEDSRTWIRLGKALHDEFGDAAMDAWIEWSSKASNYCGEKECRTRWKSIARMASGANKVTIGTLIYEAKQRGWKLKARHQINRSPEEAARLAAEREARREAARKAEEAANARAAERATRIWEAAGPAPDDHPYLTRKQISGLGLRFAPEWVIETDPDENGEVRRYTHKNALLIPIWASPGRLSSLQAIFPTKCIGTGDRARDKDYLRDGKKHGCYCVIGGIDADTSHVIVCEGYATGSSLHQATGWPVMVAFDSSNLAAVAEMVRARMPRVTIILAADNDAFTRPRPDGTPYNPGVEAATAAAKACSGVLAVPQFADVSTKPTDFNDLHLLSGLELVKAQIDVALAPPPPPSEPPPWESGDGPGPDGDAPQQDPEAPLPEPPPAPPPSSSMTLGHDHSEWFRILGFDHETYYFMSHESRQVVTCTKGDFSDTGLLELAPLEWWETEFPGEKGFNRKMAANWLIRACRDAGIYDPTRVRGRGAWLDAGRVVYHHGEKLSVDGQYVRFDQLPSRYVYEMARPLPEPAEGMLGADEGEWLIGLAEMFRWSKEGSAALLAGWVALAPVCGALRWRPHIWITGGSGTGKSTILSKYVNFLTGGLELFAQGASSEAGIRQALKADALPVLFDESESTEEGDAKRIQTILAMIRQASSDSPAKTYKGSAGGEAMAFHIRSSFALASIQVALKNAADINRISVLNLRPAREEADAAERWKQIDERLHVMAKDATMPARLFRRSLNLLPVTLKSIDVFSMEFARQFGSVRDGDQYGTLLAGAWSLISDRVPTTEEASELINRYDWSEHREELDTDDSTRALAALLEARIRIPGGVEVTVNEVLREAAGRKNDGLQLGVVSADALLQRYGMRLTADNSQLLISNSSRAIKDELLMGTQYAADPRGMLLRLPGATRYPHPVRFNGVQARCISLPTRPILSDDIIVTA